MRWSTIYRSKIVLLFVGTFMALLGNSPALAVDATGSVGAWTTSTNHAPLDVSGAASVTVNDYAYIIGGSSSSGGTWLDSVHYAKLGTDGSVGAWTTSGNSIPHGVYYPNAVAANGYIYVMGGYGGGFQDGVYYAKVNSDGSIGSWTTGTSLPQAAYEASAIAYNGYIYFMGGVNGSGTRLNTVYYAKTNSDGSIGSWSTNSNSMPGGMQDAAAVLANDRVYVMGGSTGSSYKNTVYYADINNDGSVGSWHTNTTALPQALDGPTATAANGYIYLGGGNTNSSTTKSDVYYAKVNSDGSIGSWTTGTSLPQPIRYGASLFNNGYWYVLTGQNGGWTQDTVYYAHLNFTSEQSITNTSQPLTIDTPAGTNITSLEQTAASAVDGGYSYPLGLTSFTLATNNVENQITLIFQTDLTPSQVVARKYNSVTHVYSDIPGATITETTLNGKHALQLTYTVTDGGALDEDGELNGVIVDPVGLAQVASTTSSSSLTAPNTGYGKPESNVAVIAVIALAICATGATMVSTRRKTNS